MSKVTVKYLHGLISIRVSLSGRLIPGKHQQMFHSVDTAKLYNSLGIRQGLGFFS